MKYLYRYGLYFRFFNLSFHFIWILHFSNKIQPRTFNEHIWYSITPNSKILLIKYWIIIWIYIKYFSSFLWPFISMTFQLNFVSFKFLRWSTVFFLFFFLVFCFLFLFMIVHPIKDPRSTQNRGLLNKTVRAEKEESKMVTCGWVG